MEERSSSERRRIHRYPVDAELVFKLVCGREQVAGYGRSIDISDEGIIFASKQPIPVGAQIELDVAWPTCRRPVRVWITGKTIRMNGNCAAVKIDRYEFRVGDSELSLKARTQADSSRPSWSSSYAVPF